MQAVVDASVALTDAQFGAFFYNAVGEDGDKYLLYALAGAPPEAFSGYPHPRATPVFSPTFHGEGVVRSDITRDPRYICWQSGAADELMWRECGAPPVTAPEREGFDSRLIGQLAEQIGAVVTYDWRSQGLQVELRGARGSFLAMTAPGDDLRVSSRCQLHPMLGPILICWRRRRVRR